MIVTVLMMDKDFDDQTCMLNKANGISHTYVDEMLVHTLSYKYMCIQMMNADRTRSSELYLTHDQARKLAKVLRDTSNLLIPSNDWDSIPKSKYDIPLEEEIRRMEAYGIKEE